MMVNENPAQKFLKEGLTFDDVLLIPAASEVVPRQITQSPFFTTGFSPVKSSLKSVSPDMG